MNHVPCVPEIAASIAENIDMQIDMFYISFPNFTIVQKIK